MKKIVFNRFQSLSCLCIDCNVLSCACTNKSETIDEYDDQDCIDATTSEISKDESISVNHRTVLYYSNRSYTEEQLQHSEHSKSHLDTSVNLNLKKKGINIGFLNIQGICGKEMVKFSEINLMLSSQENKKLHAFAMCETKLKGHKMSGAFKIKGFQTPFRKYNSSNCGGGIIVYIKNGIMAKRRQDHEDDNIECLWVEITPTKGKPFL